jgi:hypothetical protein
MVSVYPVGITAAPLIFRLANDVDKTNKPFVLKSAYVSSLYQARTNIEYETGASLTNLNLYLIVMI